MGGQRSTVVGHPARTEIHAQLKDGVPAAVVARQHQLSRQAVSRYRASHLGKADVVQTDDDRASMLKQVKSLYSAVVGLVQEAQQAKHPHKFLLAVAEARRCLGLLSKLMGILSDIPAPAAVNVAVQIDITELRQVIVTSLRPFPEARQACAAALVEYDDKKQAEET